jgi:hypothetical protein
MLLLEEMAVKLKRLFSDTYSPPQPTKTDATP